MKLSETQLKVLAKFEGGVVMSAYAARTSLKTLRALVKKGALRDVTPNAAGGMFSPATHYKFKKA